MEPQIVSSFQGVIIFYPCHLKQKKVFFILKESKISHIHSTQLSPLARVAAPPSGTVPVIGGAGHPQAGHTWCPCCPEPAAWHTLTLAPHHQPRSSAVINPYFPDEETEAQRA